MFRIGLMYMPAGPACEFWHLTDYWHPEYLFDITVGPLKFGVEDLITTFSVTGISATIFEFIARRRGMPKLPDFTAKIFYGMTINGVYALGVVILLATGLGMNSIYAVQITALLFAFLNSRKRKDFFVAAMPVGIIVALICWMTYSVLMPLFPGFFSQFWKLDRISGIMLGGVPVEELTWAFSVALLTGPFYRIFSLQYEQGGYSLIPADSKN
ncbi:MAG: hypothetical protein HZB33_03125 [Nitrospirae bacterium]|nr:hypothetical protein [Nitrospirota bacterium]